MSVTRAGPYLLEQHLESGGAGDVFRARAPDGAPVAIKWLRSSGGIARFERECRVQAELARDGGFVPILDAGDGALGPWIAMPLLTGGTLRERLRRGPLPVAEVLSVGRTLAAALGRAHALGLVHRDVKPENVLFDADERPLLADLGLAKHLEGDARLGLSRSLSRTGELRGTIGYLAPECVRDTKHADARADVFSLGALLYECACGSPAFEGATPMIVLSRVAAGEVRPLRSVREDVPEPLARVIERCLSPDPAARFDDGARVAAALRAAARPVRVDRGRRRVAVVTLGCAALLGAGALLVRSDLGAPETPHAVAPVASEQGPGPLDAKAAILRANLAASAGKVGEALAEVEAVLAVHPDEAGALFVRGMIRFRRGDAPGARADLDAALREGAALPPPVRARAHAARAGVRRAQGDLAGALADLEVAVAGAPDDPIARAEQADAFVALGRLDEAHEAATQALAREPRQARALLTRASVYAARGDFARSLVDSQAALEADPTMLEALLYRGLARVVLGEPNGAEDDLSAFLERRPDHLIARTARGDLRVRRGELGLGIADYDVVLAAKDDLPLRLKRAHALSRYGNAAGSDADFEHVAAQGEPALFERALTDRVLLRTNRGDFAGALADAERLVSAAPGNPDLHLLRAALLHRRGDGEAAAEGARTVLRLAAPGSKAAMNAQDLLRRLGQRP